MLLLSLTIQICRMIAASKIARREPGRSFPCRLVAPFPNSSTPRMTPVSPDGENFRRRSGNGISLSDATSQAKQAIRCGTWNSVAPLWPFT